MSCLRRRTRFFSTPVELLEFVARLRELSEGNPVGFKLCIGKRREFLGICKAMVKTGKTPDFITVDGGEGGTGAAPLEFSDHIGAPLVESLVFVHKRSPVFLSGERSVLLPAEK